MQVRVDVVRRHELEHIIRAAAEITNRYEFVVIGSQSILGSVPNPPRECVMSMEADIFPMDAEELSDKIDGAIGEGSTFHEEFGYYAQGGGFHDRHAALRLARAARALAIGQHQWTRGTVPGPDGPLPGQMRRQSREGSFLQQGRCCGTESSKRQWRSSVSNFSLCPHPASSR